jgi:hypothetical protein
MLALQVHDRPPGCDLIEVVIIGAMLPQATRWLHHFAGNKDSTSRIGWVNRPLAAMMLTDYAQPDDDEQLWTIWKGSSRVQP